MFPNPTAEPAAARMNPMRPEKFPLDDIKYRLKGWQNRGYSLIIKWNDQVKNQSRTSSLMNFICNYLSTIDV
jgi:hypothetical protein